MGEAYPELLERKDRVLATIRKEEERFGRTLTAGLSVYGEFKARMKTEGRNQLSGEEAFKLHDTFGFPVDLTQLLAEENGMTVDVEVLTISGKLSPITSTTVGTSLCKNGSCISSRSPNRAARRKIRRRM